MHRGRNSKVITVFNFISLNLKTLLKMKISLKKSPKLNGEQSKAWLISLEPVRYGIPKNKQLAPVYFPGES